MPTQSGILSPDGALVDIHLNLIAPDLLTLRRRGQPIPQPIPLKALVDPGAEISCVSNQALTPLTQLGLKPRRFVPLNMPALGGLTWGAEYAVSIVILNPGNPRAGLHLRDHLVMEQDLQLLGYDALLGRDVLRHCLFVYNGPAQQFTLAH